MKEQDWADLNELMKSRRKKLAELEAKGVKPYGSKYERTHYATEVVQDFAGLEGQEVSLAGRLLAKRGHGKASFFDLQDTSGKVQVYLQMNTVGAEQYDIFNLTDIGDILGIRGTVFKTRMGEVTIQAHQIEILSKSLRPLPENGTA